MKSANRNRFFSILLVLLLLLQCQSNEKKIDQKLSGQANNWFTIKSVADKVWCIEDHGNDNMYLVEGDDKALLIDTGIGAGDLAQCVKSITQLPVMVVNTHGHPDHVGGNFQFSKVYVHPLDWELTQQFSTQENHNNTIARILKDNPELEPALIKDISTFDAPTLEPIKARDGFDLGNRKLEIIETPGHTKGSIVLLDAEHKLLFTGDNNNTVVWLFLDGCLPIEAYLETLQKLNARNAEFDRILPGHGAVIDQGFIEEQIICAQNIISGACKGEKYESFVGPALVCEYQRARIAFDADNIFVKRTPEGKPSGSNMEGR